MTTAATNTKMSFDEEVARMNAVYAEKVGEKMTYNLLLYGPAGSGKTHLCTTGRGPFLFHMFDPGGAKIPPIQKGFREGEIMVEEFTRNIMDIPDPKRAGRKLLGYEHWVQQFESKVASGFFNNIGTFVMDSATTWIQRMMYAITTNRKREDHLPAIQDYLLATTLVLDFLTIATDLPCDFILTSHITIDKDEVSGRIHTTLNVFKGLKVSMPILFDDMYVTQAISKAEGVEYKVLTRPKGDFDAKSRLGAGVLNIYEEADLTAIIKKVEAAQGLIT